MNSAVQDVVDTAAPKNYYVDFILDKDGNATFILLDADKNRVHKSEIIVDTAMAQLNFHLQAINAPDVVWAEYFEWVDLDTGASKSAPPDNFVFTRYEPGLLASLCDHNVTKKPGEGCEYYFRMVVIANGVVYESSDPVIINKKPPE